MHLFLVIAILLAWAAAAPGQTTNPLFSTPWSRDFLRNATADPALTDLGVSTYIKTLLNDADPLTAAATLKLDHVLDARWYGVVGDGLTDDTAALQSALDAAATARASLVIPATPNFYRITAPLVLGSIVAPTTGVDIIGRGLPRILYDGAGGSDACLLAIYSCSESRLQNIWLDGNDVADVNGIFSTTYGARPSQRLQLTNVYVNNCTAHGIDIKQIDGVATNDFYLFLNCAIYDCGQGLRVRGGTQQVSWHGGNITGSGTYGIRLEAGNFVGFDCCLALNSTADIILAGDVVSCRIYNGQFESTTMLVTADDANDGMPLYTGTCFIGCQQATLPGAGVNVIDYNCFEPLTLINCQFGGDVHLGARCVATLALNNQFKAGGYTGLTDVVMYLGLDNAAILQVQPLSTVQGYATWPDSVRLRNVARTKTRGLMHADAAPVSYYYSDGDLVLNDTPAPGEPLGWMCTVSGNYGTGTILSTFAAVAPIGFLEGSLVWDCPNLVDGAGTDSNNITVTGAALGDYIMVAAPSDSGGMICFAYITAANTAKIHVQNETGGALDFASGTWRVRVLK